MDKLIVSPGFVKKIDQDQTAQNLLITENAQGISDLQDGMAIVADGDTHAAINAGQFVYVKNHDTLANGLYTANSNIAQDDPLSTSNLTADPAGGLNALSDHIAQFTKRYNFNITNVETAYTVDDLTAYKAAIITYYVNGNSSSLNNTLYLPLSIFLSGYNNEWVIDTKNIGTCTIKKDTNTSIKLTASVTGNRYVDILLIK